MPRDLFREFIFRNGSPSAYSSVILSSSSIRMDFFLLQVLLGTWIIDPRLLDFSVLIINLSSTGRM
jgi:hypothetical protein